MPYLLGLATAAVILVLVWLVWESEGARRLQMERSQTLQVASLVRARLEGTVNSHILLARGLVADVATHPDIGVAEFRRIAKELIKGHRDIRSIQLARDSVVTHIYPLAGNEQAQGLRLLELPKQREAVLRAIRTGGTVVAGPVKLVQGGMAFISRTPVYLPATGTGRGRYWGLVSLLLDRDKLFKEAGLDTLSHELRLALRGKDAKGVDGEVFYGDPAVFAARPVLADVVLPNGIWQMAAIPRKGWSQATFQVNRLWIPGVLLAVTGGWLVGLLAYRPRQLLQANLQLTAARRSAEQAARDRSRFLAAASHDVRQPLHALALFVGDLHERIQHLPEVRPLVEKIQYTTESLNELLFSLMDISKLDAGVIRPETKDFQVGRFLKRLVLENAQMALQKDLRIRVVDSGAVVRSDPLLLTSMVRNLIVNAIKYTNSGGVLVGCRRRKGGMRIEVWDTGPGIPEEELPRVFEEFYQLGNPKRDRKKGLGLGLAIVQRLADLLGVRLEVRSWVGKGTVFSIDVGEGDPARVAPPTHALVSPLSLKGLRVLVVDDEPLVLDAVCGLLENWKCEVVTADSASGAMEALDACVLPPQLILCDYQLSQDERGDRIVVQLWEKAGQKIRSVLISGDTGEEARQAAKAIGCRLWRKPVPAAKLRAFLRSVERDVKDSAA